jgi:hypothetical protein
LFRRHIAAQAEQLSATAIPFALNPAMLVVVIAVFEMPLGIPGTARHGPYSQHSPTLTLFEFAMQQLLRLCFPDCCANAEADRSRATHPVCPYCNPCGQNPQASFRLSPAQSVLAALVLKIDTIPKPDGLGMPSPTDCLEQNSNNLER